MAKRLVIIKKVIAVIALIASIGFCIGLYNLFQTPVSFQRYGYHSVAEYLHNYHIPHNEVDRYSFKLLADGFAVDKHAVFMGSTVIADVTSNRSDQYYQKFIDDYLQRSGIDPELVDKTSLNVLSLAEQIAIDKNNLFYRANIIEGIDIPSFKSFGYYGVDKNRGYRFYNGEIEIIPSTDYQTFITTRNARNYAKDGHYAYYFSNRIPEADAKTFMVLYEARNPDSEDSYAKDRQHVYLNDRVILGAHAKSFKLLANSGYSKDKKHIYYRGKRLLMANYKTFVLIDNKKGMVDAGDNDRSYYKGVSL